MSGEKWTKVKYLLEVILFTIQTKKKKTKKIIKIRKFPDTCHC